MTLRELLESGIVFEGCKKVQCWENENEPTVYSESMFVDEIPEKCMDREVVTIFPYDAGNEVAICIELAEEEVVSGTVMALDSFTTDLTNGYEANFTKGKEYKCRLEKGIYYVEDNSGKDIPFDYEDYCDNFVACI